MKISIPATFPVTTVNNVLEFLDGTKERSLLCAQTRAGKTLLATYALAKIKHDYPQAMCIIFGPNLTAFPADVISKCENIPSISDLGIEARSISGKNELLFAKDWGGSSEASNIIWAINADHTYVSKFIDSYLEEFTHKEVYIVIDEAHLGGEKTYALLHELYRYPNVSVLETTATFRNRIYTPTLPTINVLAATSNYRSPLDAELVEISEGANTYSVKHKRLHDEYIELLESEFSAPQSLVLISGQNKTEFHATAHYQVLQAARKTGTRVGILIVNEGAPRLTDSQSGETILLVKPDSTQAIKDASTLVDRAHYQHGYDHIVMIGHQMLQMGQTIGALNFPMTLQLLVHSMSSNQRAESITQWVRTGGINITRPQRIAMTRAKWSDVCAYVSANDELARRVVNRSPAEAIEILKREYLSLRTLRVEHGAWQVAYEEPDWNRLEPITQLFKVPLPEQFREAMIQRAGLRRNTTALNAWVKAQIKEQPWYRSDMSINTVRSVAKLQSDRFGGSDIQVYINRDPASEESWRRNVTCWIDPHNSDLLAIRFRPYELPSTGLVHDYYGELRFFGPRGYVLVPPTPASADSAQLELSF
jgi:hypothetical protein